MNEAQSLQVGWKLQQRLLGEPESGMGYQFITLEGLGAFVVLNATIALKLEDARDDETEREPLEGPDSALARVVRMVTEEKPVSFLAGAKASESSGQLEPAMGTELHVATHGSYQSNPQVGELFVRYSAFENDLRFGDDGGVRKGTYATTEVDSAMVPSGLAAVARYALPNKDPARYKFCIEAPLDSTIHCGTSAPKFGESGGGVEILLGCDARMVANGPSTIAER